ncbi:MAG: tetratricopeptide repeat protein [Pseudomonadota bacterium]
MGVLFAAGCATTPPLSNASGEYLSGRFAARFNQIDEAAQSFSGASYAVPEAEKIMRDAFFFHLAAGNIDTASRYAEEIAEAGIEDKTGLTQLTIASRQIKARQYTKALTTLDTEFSEPFVKSVAHLMRVWLTAGISSPSEALSELKAGGDDLFKGFDATHAGFLYEKAGEIQNAGAAHEGSAKGFGGPVGRAAFGAYLERHENADLAREYYNVLARDRGPTRRLALEGLARLDAGEPSKAFADLTVAQGVSVALYSFGGALLEQAAVQRQQASEAGFVVGSPRFNLPLTLGQLSIYLDADQVEARRLVASIYNAYDDFDAAASVLAPIPSTSAYYEQAQIELAGGLFRLGREEEAISRLKRVVTVLEDPQDARLTLGNLYASEGDHQAAVDVMSDAIDGLGDDLSKEDWRYFIVRGGSYLELDEWPPAEADLKKAVELAPEEATTLNYLGYSWAERGLNLDEAFGLIEKAVSLQPNSGAITDSLGWAYYQLGNYDEAVVQLERAATLEPDDPTITDHLGDVYWRLGRNREARYQWKHALTLEPADDLRADLDEKITSGLPPKDQTKTGEIN